MRCAHDSCRGDLNGRSRRGRGLLKAALAARPTSARRKSAVRSRGGPQGGSAPGIPSPRPSTPTVKEEGGYEWDGPRRRLRSSIAPGRAGARGDGVAARRPRYIGARQRVATELNDRDGALAGANHPGVLAADDRDAARRAGRAAERAFAAGDVVPLRAGDGPPAERGATPGRARWTRMWRRFGRMERDQADVRRRQDPKRRGRERNKSGKLSDGDGGLPRSAAIGACDKEARDGGGQGGDGHGAGQGSGTDDVKRRRKRKSGVSRRPPWNANRSRARECRRRIASPQGTVVSLTARSPVCCGAVGDAETGRHRLARQLLFRLVPIIGDRESPVIAQTAIGTATARRDAAARKTSAPKCSRTAPEADGSSKKAGGARGRGS